MANRWSVEEENLLADMWNEVTERFNNQSDGPFRNKQEITGK